MSLQLLKAGTSDVLTLNGISKRAFDSDILVGAASPSGPPGYMSMSFHMKMVRLIQPQVTEGKKLLNILF